MKKKYTREQLEFYFNKLMHRLGRIPTEEDMDNAKDLPSVSVYTERFGSWSTIKHKLGLKELNKKKCQNCGKEIGFKKQTKLFCSATCSKQFRLKETFKKVPPKKCNICNKDYHIFNTPNFKMRKICTDITCKTRWGIVQEAKKNKRLTPGLKKKLMKLKNNKCLYCDFKEVLFFLTPGRHTEKKLIHMIQKKDFSYVLVCPNHHALIKAKKMKL